MKFGLMQEVYIQSDTFNLGAPVGERAIVARLDPSILSAQPYCVRVPSSREWYWLPECDVVDATEWLSKQADDVIQQSIVNKTLDDHDRAGFVAATRRERGDADGRHGHTAQGS